jgi:hypothetical protein
MAAYTYGRIGKLAESLTEAGINPAITLEIMAGGETITPNTSGEAKAEWMAGAMRRMNGLLDFDTRRSVREACACCLGGKRLKLSKGISRQGGTLEERIAVANETRYVFGHSVSMEADGRILVRFAPDESENNRCVCLPKAQGTVPVTYCYCCGGHIKHHLQIALDRELEMMVRSSALSSAGKRPCSFWFKIKEN